MKYLEDVRVLSNKTLRNKTNKVQRYKLVNFISFSEIFTNINKGIKELWLNRLV